MIVGGIGSGDGAQTEGGICRGEVASAESRRPPRGDFPR
jgi:hypothetical protein